MDIINQLIKAAKQDLQRIVLPEGTERRTLRAANRALSESMANIILLGNRDEILSLAKDMLLNNIEKENIIYQLINTKS